MLRDFFDNHPVPAAVLILLLLTLIPALFVVAMEALFGTDFPSGKVIFVMWLVFQLILSSKCERPILTTMPFLISLAGVLLCEWIYVGMTVTYQVGVSPTIGRTLLSLGVAIFGPEAAAAVGGMVAYMLFSLVRGIIGK